jgi:hypothetical protein
MVFLLEDVNKSFNAFMITFIYHFNVLFPTKISYLHKNNKNKWMTRGVLVSRNGLWILNGLKRSTHISAKLRHCINRYQLIYTNLIKEAKKLENDNFILSSKNKSKGIWQVINKEIGNLTHKNYNIQLQNNTELITDPNQISEKFNSYFIDTVNDLVNKNS